MYELYKTGFGCNRKTSAPGDVGLMEKHSHVTVGAVLALLREFRHFENSVTQDDVFEHHSYL